MALYTSVCSLLLTPHFFEQRFRLLLPCAQGFQLGQVLHSDQDAADACAVDVDLPGQHQAALVAQHVAAFQRLTRCARRRAQLLQQVRARQQHKHLGRRRPGAAHRAQPLQAAGRSIGRDQAQLRPMLVKSQQGHRHGIEHGLQAGLHREQRSVIWSDSGFKRLKHGRELPSRSKTFD
jgi:hypothetical protein